MSSTSLPLPHLSAGSSRGAGLAPMIRIEARRFARHPVFLVGVLLSFAVMTIVVVNTRDDPRMHDMLSTPIVPAFFIGLTSLIAAHRLTKSTDAAEEAVGTAPGTEARRTSALLAACVVPFLAGLAWTVALVTVASVWGTTAQDWWFATMPDWQVWSILIVLGPVACLGGGLLGVLSGRWLHFPGAAAATLITVLAVVYVTMGLAAYSDVGNSHIRLWVPWPGYHSGTQPDGTQDLYAGNPAFSLLYELCLCAAAGLAALWHDRTARTPQLRLVFVAVVVVGLGALALSMTTGNPHDLTSDPIPWLTPGN